MKSIVKKAFMLLVFGIVLMNTAAAEATTDHEKASSFMQQQVDKMDPAVQPYAQLVADNIVATFIFFVGGFILIDTILASYSKKRGRTNDSAGYKHSQWETFAQGIIGIVLFGIFAAIVQSGKIGLI